MTGLTAFLRRGRPERGWPRRTAAPRLRRLELFFWPAGAEVFDGRTADAPVELAELFRLGLVFAAVGVAIQSVVSFVNNVVFSNPTGVLSADEGNGVFGWLGLIAEIPAVAAVVLLALAIRPHRLRLSCLAALLAFLTLDDVSEIHERVSSLETNLNYCAHCGRTLWPIVYFPLLAVTFALLWSLVAAVRPRTRTFVRLGLCLLVAAVLLEGSSPLLFHHGWGHGSAPYELEVVFEEGSEYVGWMLITTALLTLALEAWLALPRPRRSPLSEGVPTGGR